MVNEKYQIRWDHHALIQFKEIYVYIRKDSYQSAQKVKRKILEMIGNLKLEPRRYHPDKFRIDGNKDFRSFEVYNIRVTYFIDKDNKTVNILRVRGTRKDPLPY